MLSKNLIIASVVFSKPYNTSVFSDAEVGAFVAGNNYDINNNRIKDLFDLGEAEVDSEYEQGAAGSNT